MHESTPPEHVHALGIDRLRAPDIRFWSAWAEGALIGCGALKRLDATHEEIKSMRVHDAYRGQGFGRAILDHLLDQASISGARRVSLETGTGDDFQPAIALYERAGFRRCGPFGDYREGPFSVFMTLSLGERTRE